MAGTSYPWSVFAQQQAGIVLVLICMSGAAGAYTLEVPWASRTVEADGRLELLHVERIEEENPHQDPRGRLRVGLGTELLERVRFEGLVNATAGGTSQNAEGAGIFSLDETLQDISPSLDFEEAYLDVVLPSVDVRAGLQKFAWGKLDGSQPNDLLNPEEFYDFLLEDEDERKIGIPALSFTAHVPSLPAAVAPTDVRLTGVWAPVVVPFRFPDDDERWYPPLARVPERTISMGLVIENRSEFRNGDVPGRDLENGAGAARLAARFAGADFSLYYYDGYDPGPAFEVSARTFVRSNPGNPQGLDVRSEIDVFPELDRIRAAGGDVAFSFFGATLRAEGAWVHERLYPKAIRDVIESQRVGAVDPAKLASGMEQEVTVALDPVNVERDGVEWGAGGDYVWGDTFVLLEVMQTLVLDNRERLLISDEETRFAVTVRRSFLAERAEAELVGLYGLQSVYGVAHPRFTVDVTDEVDVRLGVLWIQGHEDSLLGQYDANDEGYVRIRYFF